MFRLFITFWSTVIIGGGIALTHSSLIAAAEEPTERDEAAAPIVPPVRELGGGLFQIGGVELDQNKRTASFAAVVNMTDGAIEYVVVAERGKLHESLFRTSIEPYHLHVAMLLLGVTPSNQAATAETAPGTIDAAYLKSAPALTGEPVSLSVTWKTNSTEKKSAVEDLVLNTETKVPMSRGPWIYTGSMFHHGTFTAQRDRSIVSIISDPNALINNPRRGRTNDRIWDSRTKKLPPVNTPVRITVQAPITPQPHDQTPKK